MAADQERFQQILTSLSSSENEVRVNAEKTYNEIPPESRVVLLLGTLQNAAKGEDQRQMASILLRRMFSTEFTTFFPKLLPEAQQELKRSIIATLQIEQSDYLRRKCCETAAELARNLIDDDGNNTWPEFLQFLFQCANSPSPIMKESALRMFASFPGVFGNQQTQHMDLIKQMLQQALVDVNSYEVRFQAVKAVTAFIMLHDKEDPIHRFLKELLPPLVQVIVESVSHGTDDALLKCLIDLADSAPKYLRSQLDIIMQLCLKVMSTDDILPSWKHLALEVVVTLSEAAPAMMRKDAGRYIPDLIPLILNQMTDLTEDPEWSIADEIVEDDSDSNNIVAETGLDRLACGLGGKTVLPQVIATIPRMLESADWKQRYAALMAISAIGEGCSKQMEGMLGQIMDGVLRYLSDPHPRVRYAACNAIGQMSTDFAPGFEKKFHARVIPGLLMVLEDNQNPRVQAHAGAALVNFSEDCPKNILVQYLNEIMAQLETILTAKFNELVTRGTKLVLEQVVTTIASVADTTQEQFVPYYDRLMPCLKYIIENANTPELKMLRGKTIECVSLIGLAVGKEKFQDDAVAIMDLLLKTHGVDGELPDDDPQRTYLISAWARICKILGKQFQQYLPLVIGPVMKTAAMKPEVAVMDNEDMDEISDDDDWQFVSLGEQQNFGIRTSGIEEKATACDMLVCYAQELKEAFAEYAEPVVKLMVPMLKFYFHDGVRTAAAQSLPCLLECAKAKGTSFLGGMWEYICPDLLKAIETEPEVEVKHELMYSLALCITTLGKGFLADETIKEMLRIIDQLLQQHQERAAERLDKRKDEDYDEVVEEQLEDEDNDDNFTLNKIADILHALFTVYKEEFYSYFDHLLMHFVLMVGADKPWSDRQWGLCVFDDVIEFGGPACIKYQQYFVPPILDGISDKVAAVRQAAAYGIGTLAMNAGPAFAGTCAEAIPLLVKVINDPESRSSENINSTENAISAVTKILQHNNSAVNVDEILPHWMSWLPVWEDTDEAPHVYGYLCQLIETNNTIILGPNSSNIPRLIALIAEAFNRDAIAPEHLVAQRMINIVRQIQGSGEIFNLCISQLTAEQQVALHDVLNKVN